MKDTIDNPGAQHKWLLEQLVQMLGYATKEARAIALYREKKLSIGQVAELLELSVDEADSLMKAHCIDGPFTPGDRERDRATVNYVFVTDDVFKPDEKRRTEHGE